MTVALTDVATAGARIIQEVERAVVGKRPLLFKLLAAVLGGGHVLLEDYPGLAKTLIAKSFAVALGLNFKRVQFTPDLLPGDITGSYIFDRASGQFELRPGPIFRRGGEPSPLDLDPRIVVEFLEATVQRSPGE